MMPPPVAAGARAHLGPIASPVTLRARAFVAARRERAEVLGRALAVHVHEPDLLVGGLRRALTELGDPTCRAGLAIVAPGIGPTYGVRNPLLGALGRGFRAATRRDSSTTLLLAADRLLHEPEMEPRWFALGLLAELLPRETERTWQVLRRVGHEATDWITVDTLAHIAASGILREPYRWAELEQLVYSPSRWERRLAASTVATMPSETRRARSGSDVARPGLGVLELLMGDAEPDVQKALAWAYRSLLGVDRDAAVAGLEAQLEIAVREADGHRAWVIRDAAAKLPPADAAVLRTRLAGIRRRPGAPGTSIAAATAARFATMGLGRPLPEPPLT
jgi:3-methyladenine DNA glycosylase AlkD